MRNINNNYDGNKCTGTYKCHVKSKYFRFDRKIEEKEAKFKRKSGC